MTEVFEATPALEVFEGTDGEDIYVFEPGDSGITVPIDQIQNLEPGDKIDLTAFGLTGFRFPGSAFDPNTVVIRDLSPNVIIDGGSGANRFQIRIQDASVADVIAALVLEPDLNTDPVAVDDSGAGDEDMTISGNVLTNDSDVESAMLTASLNQAPANGSVVVNPDGNYLYTPDADFNGTDSFTYTVSDGTGGTDTGTVNLTVNPVQDAPEAVDDSYGADVDAVLTVDAAAGLLANDTDVDGDALTAVIATGPSNGAVTIDPDGGFTYTPDMGFAGTDSFTYVANDGTEDSAAATVTVTVAANTPPVAVDDSASTEADTAVAGNVLDNDSDPDGDTLTATEVTGPANGTLSLGSNGAFTYTPDGGFFGTDSFTYAISDGRGGGDQATVTITVAEPASGTIFEATPALEVFEGTDDNDTYVFEPGDSGRGAD